MNTQRNGAGKGPSPTVEEDVIETKQDAKGDRRGSQHRVSRGMMKRAERYPEQARENLGHKIRTLGMPGLRFSVREESCVGLACNHVGPAVELLLFTFVPEDRHTRCGAGKCDAEATEHGHHGDGEVIHRARQEVKRGVIHPLEELAPNLVGREP